LFACLRAPCAQFQHLVLLMALALCMRPPTNNLFHSIQADLHSYLVPHLFIFTLFCITSHHVIPHFFGLATDASRHDQQQLIFGMQLMNRSSPPHTTLHIYRNWCRMGLSPVQEQDMLCVIPVNILICNTMDERIHFFNMARLWSGI
jgi:hypothetical protein